MDLCYTNITFEAIRPTMSDETGHIQEHAVLIAIFNIFAEKELTVAEANSVLKYLHSRIKRIALLPRVDYDKLIRKRE